MTASLLKYTRLFLSILTDLNNVVVWIISILPQISSSSILCYKSLETVISAPTILVNTITLMFHDFFDSQATSKYFFYLFAFFYFQSAVCRNSKNPQVEKLFFFLLINTMLCLLVGFRRIVCISNSQRILRVSFSGTDSGLGTYHVILWSNFTLLRNSLYIPFPTQS